MLKFNPLLPRKPPVIVRYEVAVLSVTVALIIALFLHIHWMPASGVLFLCAFMFIAWYGGVTPTLLAMSRSLLAFKYYVATSLHSLTAEIKAIPRILVFSLALVSSVAVAQTAVEPPRTIQVVMDNAYAPYSFQSAEGKLQGILIDQWQAWEKKTGIKVELHAMDWGDAVRRMRAGEFDVIDSIVETPERRDYFDFTPAYTPIEASIFFRNDISGITDLASLKGFPVGVKAGDQHVDQLKEHGITTAILFQNNEAIIESAKQRKINVFVVDDPSALYLLNKMGIEAEFRHSAPIFRDELRRAVRKGDAVLLRTVSEGFAAIAPGELKQIDEKWFGRTINNYVRYFTYAGYTAAVTILLIAVLVGWNRTLKRRILQRTAALGESEQRFRQIAENIHEVFWLTTVDFNNILYISPAYEAVWGRPRESLYREPRSFFATIHPEDRSRVSTLIDRDREQGFEVEYRVVRPDGSIRWIFDRGFPIKDDSGRCYRVAGIAEDITERKHAGALLHAKEQEFRAIVENAPDQIIRYDREFRRTYVNPAVAQIYGLLVETLIDEPLGSGIVEAGLDVKEDELAQFRQRIAAVFDTGKSSEYENSWPMPTGRRYYSIRLFPELDLNGSVINVLGIARDITERKQAEDALRQSEDHLRLVIDTIPTMAWTLRPDAVLDFVNKRWLDYTGLTFEEAIEDETRTVHPEDLSRVMANWLKVKATSEAYEDEMRLQRADGEYRWFLIRIAPLLDEQGNLLKRYGVAIDIEERKRAEEEIHRHAARMEARAEISQALAKVGLDVRTVLDTIARYTAEVIGDKCVIRLLSSDEKRFNLAAFHHPKPETLALMKSLYPGTPIAASHKWAGHVLQTRQPLLIPIVNQEQLREITQPEYLPFVEQVGMHSILVLPLCVDGRVIGSLALSRDHPEHPYTPDDQVFLQDLADRAALTIQNAQLFEQVQNAHQRLQSLSRSLLEVQENERRHIARELHDEIGQVLTGIKLSLERSAREPPDCVKSSVSQALGLVTELVGRVRDLSLELRPAMLDDLGLLSALRWQLGRYTSQFEIRVNFKHSRLDEQRFAPDIETAAYRIVQEALTNVARHAGVGKVDVDIQADESRIRIRIRDEGIGFDAHTLSASSTGGLSGMRERASMLGGQLDVESAPGAGTLLRAELPLRMTVDNH